MWVLLVFIILSLYLWFLVRWWRVRNFWAEKNVPHLPPHPLTGSLNLRHKENPAVMMRRIYTEFRSPYVGIWLFWQPCLIVNCPNLARNILVKDFEVFRNRYANSGNSDPIGNLNLFMVNDPAWSSIRRRLTPVFTSAKLKMFQQIPQIKSKHLVDRLISDTKKGIKINLRSPRPRWLPQVSLHVAFQEPNIPFSESISHSIDPTKDLFTDYTTDVIGETAFGMQSDSVLTGDSPLREITREFMRFDFVRALTWTCIFFCPKLTDLFGLSMFPKHSVTYLKKIFRAMVQQRGGYEKEVTEMKSLFDALIKIKQESAKEGEDISEDLLIAQATIFLQGGFETTATTLTFAIYEMAYQPHIQGKLYQELTDANLCSTNKLDAQKLSELPYLNAVIKESLRKYPVLGTLDRVVLKDYQVDQKLTIPAGTVVYVNAVGMQSSADYFSDPEEFDPERFMPGNEELIKPYTYMPFGTGPRHCIGERFAAQSMRFALASLILNFEIQLLPDSPIPNQLEIERNGLLLSPGGKISVNFVLRNK